MAKTSKKTAIKKAAPAKASTSKKAVTRKAAVKKAAPKKKAAAKKKTTAKKTVARKAPAKQPAVRQITADDRHRMIAEAAYLRAESNGFLSHAQDDWLSAEAEIDALLATSEVTVLS